MKQHTYIAIDLKSFYASVECRERGLSLIHISEPTRQAEISYAVFCLKKKKKTKQEKKENKQQTKKKKKKK